MLGVIYKQLGNLMKALEYFEIAQTNARNVLDFNTFLNSINQVGHIKVLGGLYDEAISEFRTALDWDQTRATFWSNLAWTQWLAGDWDAAVATTTDALNAIPDEASLHRSRSEYLLALEKVDEAVADAEAAADDDRSAATLLTAGHAYEAAGRLDEALESFGLAEEGAEGDELEHARDDRQRLERMRELDSRLDSLVAGEDLREDVESLLAAARLCSARCGTSRSR